MLALNHKYIYGNMNKHGEPDEGNVNKTRRLMLGLFILLLVDVIWVASSELTKYIYCNEKFEKPFFNTYVKTSMFSLYLFGLCFWPPWRETLNRPADYALVEESTEDENYYTDVNNSLSDPTYVPLRNAHRVADSAEASGAESDDAGVERSVRFSKTAEVRQMSESVAWECAVARLSWAASVRAAREAHRRQATLSVRRQARLAFTFCLLWFCANYTYQAALSWSEVGVVTALSSTSSLFTLLLASAFPAGPPDRFTLSKLLAVLLSIAGLVVVSLSDAEDEGSSGGSRIPGGALLSLLSSFLYAAYLVMLRRNVKNEDNLHIPLFFGFVGLINMTSLWPVGGLLHFMSIEQFEWPTRRQWAWLLLNGLVGTVLSEVLWLWGCFLTSSLVATVAISLTIPLSLIADAIIRRVEPPKLLYLGVAPMLLAFLAVTVLAHRSDWDPVADAMRKIQAYLVGYRNSRISLQRIPDIDDQTEALISINSSQDEHEA